jgi:hypothetical protein
MSPVYNGKAYFYRLLGIHVRVSKLQWYPGLHDAPPPGAGHLAYTCDEVSVDNTIPIPITANSKMARHSLSMLHNENGTYS